MTDIGIGGRLRAARQRLDWSREELAFRSGVSWSAIAQIEAGRRRNLRQPTLGALSEALGVTIDYLVSGRAGSPMLTHCALLYDTDQGFVKAATPVLGDALERSEGVLAVTSPANIELLRSELGSRAGSVEFAEAESWYTTPIAALDRYRAFLDAQIQAGVPWITIVGEPVWAGRSDSEVRFWTRYESLLNLVFSFAPATVLCSYDTRSVPTEVVAHARATHPNTLEREQRRSSRDYTDPADFMLGE